MSNLNKFPILKGEGHVMKSNEMINEMIKLISEMLYTKKYIYKISGGYGITTFTLLLDLENNVKNISGYIMWMGMDKKDEFNICGLIQKHNEHYYTLIVEKYNEYVMSYQGDNLMIFRFIILDDKIDFDFQHKEYEAMGGMCNKYYRL